MHKKMKLSNKKVTLAQLLDVIQEYENRTGLDLIQLCHNEARAKNRFQAFDRKYLKPLLIRPDCRKMRGLSLLNVYQKLNEKEAQEYLNTHGSFYAKDHDLTNSKSLYKLFQSSSQSSTSLNKLNDSTNGLHHGERSPSIPLDTSTSHTCLDMHVLDATEDSKKIQEATSYSHLLNNAMFKPRKKVVRHRRHMLPEEEHHGPFHHKARLHLRHLLSGGHRHHGHKHGHGKRRSRHGSMFHSSSHKDLDKDHSETPASKKKKVPTATLR